ncbi:hypothetical protein [Erwinia mallotivora]|uniref:Uncharacterized protein n=1 Tax=Erwinia mallotivora TaxID=69222 RepID=A0A014NPZ3_9GAMM|nr:hypothetical protein [Erwinia mallotivora]EXU75895.1 hypothetical protein BG55_08805 [Erwinia mallotivora]
MARHIAPGYCVVKRPGTLDYHINKIMSFYYTFLTGTGFTVFICFMGLIINLTHPNTATPAAQ